MKSYSLETAQKIADKSGERVVPAFCAMCGPGPIACGIYAFVKDGRFIKAAGMKECPVNQGSLSSKAYAREMGLKTLTNVAQSLNPQLLVLGVRAVIAVSFERIHRSNLVGMGVLPLQFHEGDTHGSLGLDGTETFDIAIDDRIQPRQPIPVVATKPDGGKLEFTTICRIDTPVEVDYYRNGGILHTVLRKMAKA